MTPLTPLEQLRFLASRYQSQRALAREMGVSQGLISLMLAEKRAITPDIAATIADCYQHAQ